MKKKSAGAIIARTFLKTIGTMLLFVAVGVISYYLTLLFYKQTAREERSTKYTHVIDVNAGSESSNLIYSYDEKTGKIKALVLELFDKTTKNLDYFTIPANTQVTISGDVYAELAKENTKVPQVVKMSEVTSYFEGDVAYEYGIMILQCALPVDIGYFTALPEAKFNECFAKKSKLNPVYAPSKEMLEKAKACSTSSDMEDLMEEMWDTLISDITLSQKQNYAEALVYVKQEYIRANGVYGEKTSDGFTIDETRSRRMINKVWESEAYTTPQISIKGSLGSSSEEEGATGRTIQVTNGTGITGLASRYQQKLVADGYNVVGVGNYVGGTQTSTTIYARKKKWGKALKKYFKNAVVQQADALTNGADIEIVLGTEDDLP